MGKNLITALIITVSSTSPYAGAEAVYEYGRYKTTVIEDRGGLSTRTYIRTAMDSEKWGKKLYEERGNKKLINSMYPVRTPSMSVGQVGREEGTEIPPMSMVTQPMFIIGDDPVSQRWLADNREFLHSKKAIGLVVNVENKAQMDQLSQIAGKGIRMQPTAGEDFAKHLGIQHYPFYMDKDGIMR